MAVDRDNDGENGGADQVGGGDAGVDRRRLLGGALAVTAAGAALAACGTSGGKPGSPPVRPAAHPGTLLPSNEQTRPGDADWRMTSAGPQNAIEGYPDKVSVLPGDPVGLHVSTTGTSFVVKAYRVGWYGGAQARLVWQSDPTPGKVQAAVQVTAPTRTVTTAWEQSLSVPTTGWPEGAYLLRLDADNGHQRYVPLVVRSAGAKGKMVLMHAPATWQAYNTWHGYSLYQGPDGNYDSRSYVVSFDRPYDDVGAVKFLVYERAAVVLAERLGLPLAYTTGLDVHTDPTVLDGATALISLGHDEYWTPEQRRSVTAARDAGTNLAFLGANTCFRRIQYRDTALGANRAVACYKTAYDKDPLYPAHPAMVTTDFRAAPGADPESSLTGVLYEGFPVDAPYVVHSPDHWLFAGTGATRGASFDHLIGVEYDRVTPGQPTPRPLEILAHSPLVCEKKHSYSDTAYYTVPSGAGVFASGTMRWVEGLMAGTRDDGGDHAMDARTGAFVTQVTENLFRAFAAGAGKSKPAPADNVKEVYI